MKSMDLPKIAETKPKYRSQKTKNEGGLKNEAKKNFTTKKPDLVWVSDITYIKMKGLFMCYYRFILPKSNSLLCKNKMDTSLVEETFKKAYANNMLSPNQKENNIPKV